MRVLIFLTLLMPLAVADEFTEERKRMVERQLKGRDIANERVLESFLKTPRHLFIPEGRRGAAYQDRPVPIGFGQTISQPYIVAYMTQIIDPQPDDVVLEIGSGSGYQAAILAPLVEHVYTIEIIPELAASAEKKLENYENVTVKHGDGYYGWPEHAPFDAIIVTAAAEHIPPPLIRQLKKGGEMIIPVGSPFRAQQLVLVKKDSEGKRRTKALMPVRFVPFTRSGE